MSSAFVHDVVASSKVAQWGTRALFLVAGLVTAAWASLVPDAKARTGLDEGELGLVLLCLGVGSILAMPVAGVLSTRHGCRKVLIVCGSLMCISLPLLAVASSIWTLGLALFLFGAVIGMFDCVMNVQAIIVERDSNVPLMSGFHGLYSLGGIVGAALCSGIMMAGFSPLNAVLMMTMLTATIMAFGLLNSLSYGNPAEGPAFAFPKGTVLFLGLLCFTVFLAEGSMLDWSGVLLTEQHGMSHAQAGFGFACFSVTMTIGRLLGDRIVDRLGRRRVVMAGGVLAAAGILVATLLPGWPLALLGFALVGLGCSNIVPVLFTAVGRQTSMPQQVAVPAMSTLGYAGVLAGPAGIGFIAHQSSLPTAFLLVALMLVGVGISGRFLKV